MKVVNESNGIEEAYLRQSVSAVMILAQSLTTLQTQNTFCLYVLHIKIVSRVLIRCYSKVVVTQSILQNGTQAQVASTIAWMLYSSIDFVSTKFSTKYFSTHYNVMASYYGTIRSTLERQKEDNTLQRRPLQIKISQTMYINIYSKNLSERNL